jgi:hypothetical protein
MVKDKQGENKYDGRVRVDAVVAEAKNFILRFCDGLTVR